MSFGDQVVAGAGRPLVLDLLADRIEARRRPSFTRVAVDGPDGAGKTTLADELAELLTHRCVPVVRVSLDGFHHPRSVRYRRGRGSPVGFVEDSYDLAAFRREVLVPLAPGGDGRYRGAVHDVEQDIPIVAPRVRASAGAVLLVDGLFLHRRELHEWWDLTIYVDADIEVRYERMAVRDGTDRDPWATTNRRYTEGQRLYVERDDPRTRASLVSLATRSLKICLPVSPLAASRTRLRSSATRHSPLLARNDPACASQSTTCDSRHA